MRNWCSDEIWNIPLSSRIRYVQELRIDQIKKRRSHFEMLKKFNSLVGEKQFLFKDSNLFIF